MIIDYYDISAPYLALLSFTFGLSVVASQQNGATESAKHENAGNKMAGRENSE